MSGGEMSVERSPSSARSSKKGFLQAARMHEIKNDPGNWVLLDDGSTGQSVFFINIVTKERQRNRPNCYVDRKWADGTRAYVFLGKCSECREPMEQMPRMHILGRTDALISFIVCDPCLARLQRNELKRQGSSATAGVHLGELLQGNCPPPKCMYFCVRESVEDPDRETKVTDRAKLAQDTVLESVARARETEQRRWLENRCAREYNQSNGEYKTFVQGPHATASYFGELEGFVPHGRGLLVLPDGSEYYGEWMNGMRHGPEAKATFKWSDGRKYVGGWLADKMHGKGVLTFPDGTVFDGVFLAGKQHGKGVITYPDGCMWKGHWKLGARDGEGTYISARGVKEKREYHEQAEEKEDDPANARIRFRPPDMTAHHDAEEEPDKEVFNPPSLLSRARDVLAHGLSQRPHAFPPAILVQKLVPHLRTRVAKTLLDGLKTVSTALKERAWRAAWQQVTTADFSGSRLHTSELKLVAHFLGGAAETLKSLQLVGASIHADQVHIAAAITHSCQRLCDLDLSYNPLGKDGMTVLAKALIQAPWVERLALAGCKLGPKGGEALCSVLTTPTTNVTDLNVAFNDLGLGGAITFARTLAVNRTLTSLNIRGNVLGAKGGALMADAFAMNGRTLRMLVIADNHLGERVSALIASKNKNGASRVLKGLGKQSVYRPVTVAHIEAER